jgi:hypothetical protein
MPRKAVRKGCPAEMPEPRWTEQIHEFGAPSRRVAKKIQKMAHRGNGRVVMR